MLSAILYQVRSSLGICLLAAGSLAMAQASRPSVTPAPRRGKALFARNCAFCHGRDAAGGESGPNLTRLAW